MFWDVLNNLRRLGMSEQAVLIIGTAGLPAGDFMRHWASVIDPSASLSAGEGRRPSSCVMSTAEHRSGALRMLGIDLHSVRWPSPSLEHPSLPNFQTVIST